MKSRYYIILAKTRQYPLAVIEKGCEQCAHNIWILQSQLFGFRCVCSVNEVTGPPVCLLLFLLFCSFPPLSFHFFFQSFACFPFSIARCVHPSRSARTMWPYPPQSQANRAPKSQNRGFFGRTFRLRTSQTQRVRAAWPRRVLKRLLF